MVLHGYKYAIHDEKMARQHAKNLTRSNKKEYYHVRKRDSRIPGRNLTMEPESPRSITRLRTEKV